MRLVVCITFLCWETFVFLSLLFCRVHFLTLELIYHLLCFSHSYWIFWFWYPGWGKEKFATSKCEIRTAWKGFLSAWRTVELNWSNQKQKSKFVLVFECLWQYGLDKSISYLHNVQWNLWITDTSTQRTGKPCTSDSLSIENDL